MSEDVRGEGRLIVPDEATQKEILHLWRQVVSLDRPRAEGRADTGVKPQDKHSGLVEREWTRTSRRRGTLTERTLEGQQVTARFID